MRRELSRTARKQVERQVSWQGEGKNIWLAFSWPFDVAFWCLPSYLETTGVTLCTLFDPALLIVLPLRINKWSGEGMRLLSPRAI
jgi:hypothetical protein